MTTPEEKHELRDHLAVISTSAYFLLQSDDADTRLDRYDILQYHIDAIIAMIDEQADCHQKTSTEMLFQ